MPNFLDIYHKSIATGMGFGLSPFAPGTAGAFFATLLLFPISISAYSTYWLIGLTVLFYFLGVSSTNYVEKAWGEKDPSRVVIDEVIGLWITILFVPINLKTAVLAFLLFRVFDIWKPLGIRKLERIKGGHGVMLDDVLAGIYANVALQLIYHFLLK